MVFVLRDLGVDLTTLVIAMCPFEFFEVGPQSRELLTFTNLQQRLWAEGPESRRLQSEVELHELRGRTGW